MSNLTYKRMLFEDDIDVPQLISIDERNTASLRLFENAGFICVSKEDELINFVYQIRKD